MAPMKLFDKFPPLPIQSFVGEKDSEALYALPLVPFATAVTELPLWCDSPMMVADCVILVDDRKPPEKYDPIA